MVDSSNLVFDLSTFRFFRTKLLQVLFLSRTTWFNCLRNLPQGFFTDVIVKVVEKTNDFRIFLEVVVAEEHNIKVRKV